MSVRTPRITRIRSSNPVSEAARLKKLGAFRSPRGRIVIGTRKDFKRAAISKTDPKKKVQTIMQFGKNERNLAAWRLRKQRQKTHQRMQKRN